VPLSTGSAKGLHLNCSLRIKHPIQEAVIERGILEKWKTKTTYTEIPQKNFCGSYILCVEQDIQSLKMDTNGMQDELAKIRDNQDIKTNFISKNFITERCSKRVPWLKDSCFCVQD
jgi:hypothetical protein